MSGNLSAVTQYHLYMSPIATMLHQINSLKEFANFEGPTLISSEDIPIFIGEMIQHSFKITWIKKFLGKLEKKLLLVQEKIFDSHISTLEKGNELTSLFNPLLSILQLSQIHIKEVDALAINDAEEIAENKATIAAQMAKENKDAEIILNMAKDRVHLLTIELKNFFLPGAKPGGPIRAKNLPVLARL